MECATFARGRYRIPPRVSVAIGSLGDFRYPDFSINWRGGKLISIRGAARSECQLARRLHKNPPRPASKCAVSAHPARSGAPPARFAGCSLVNRFDRRFSLAVKNLPHNFPEKHLILKEVAGKPSRHVCTPQVAGGQSVKGIRLHLGPSARATPKFRSIEFHFVM